METRASTCMCVVVCVAALLSIAAAAGWDYLDGAKGPSTWATNYETCGGMKQSPIDIVTSKVVDEDLGDFTFVGFGEDDEPVDAEMTLENNGHSIVVGVTGDYQVSGAGLGTTAYKVVQFHFHWGSVNSQGSEHTIDGKAYPGELHVVCFNTKYADFVTALNEPDGLTVLGFFLDVQAADNSVLAPLFDLLSMIRFEHEEEDLSTPVVFKNFFPADLSSYYRYSGSLTTPPCYEIVTWNVFTEPIMVSEAQLMLFRRQFANEQDAPANISLVDTFRPVEPVNDRTIYMNSGTAALVASYSLIAMVLVKVLASVLED
ncbi:carbonic anhydrase 2-like [Patiria miniata]|uniref:Carbonic anhydrase n=1 Tax=Patiria miniata TaxID=46514 RepID=A0A913ZPU7_PATMI|nr:carbonic anhydrase 2-like [Patiria miniata]